MPSCIQTRLVPSFPSRLVSGQALMLGLGAMLAVAAATGCRARATHPPSVRPAGASAQASTVPTSIPAQRELAERLVGRFDRLSVSERRTLRKLGDEAFAALLPLAKERLQAFEEAKRTDKRYRGPARAAYERLYPVMEALCQVATKPRTPEMLALLTLAKTPGGGGEAMRWLAEKGDERQTLPLFLSILKRREPDWDYLYSPSSLALSAVARSHDPRAVGFLLAQLSDPKADPAIRHRAYISLAQTGGTAGREAVLAAQDTRRTIPSLRWFVGMDELGAGTGSAKIRVERHWPAVTALLATHAAKSGILWGLFASRALGSAGDLWIAKHAGERWSTPIFTGMSREELGQADWYRKLVGNPALTRDRDGDGFTDLVERRLGTNPRQADSDGDGLIDSRDRNPLAAPRRLSEREQVLAAAFEARFRFLGERDVPCLVNLPPGVAPLELAGWDWIVIPRRAGARSPLMQASGKGLAVVRFSPPYNPASAGREWWHGPVPRWNKAHTEASLGLSTYYAGLDGTGFNLRLRKYGRRWLVVEEQLIWVS